MQSRCFGVSIWSLARGASVRGGPAPPRTTTANLPASLEPGFGLASARSDSSWTRQLRYSPEVAMDDLPLTELGDTERRLLSVFIRYGRDGRAFTTQSLAVNAGVPADSWGLATALNNLAVKGLIKRGGGDPFP